MRFIGDVANLITAIGKGLVQDLEIRVLLFLLTLLLVSSTLFYEAYEGWSHMDALYYSVMTMSTIGYGDFVPTMDSTKLFTIVFTFLSVGVFVSLNTKIVMLILTERKAEDSRLRAKYTKN